MMKRVLEHVLRTMRAYLADCGAHGVLGDLRTTELNDAICACVGTLADQRRRQRAALDTQEGLDALAYAMRYVDHQIDINLDGASHALQGLYRKERP